MNQTSTLTLALAIFAGATFAGAGSPAAAKDSAATTHTQQTHAMPEMPKPVEQHAWLQKFVGEWTTQVTIPPMGPDQQPTEFTGSESVRALGGFWVIGENHGTCPMDAGPYTGVITLGYDPVKQKYIGTWVDSMTSLLWKYEGTLDATGKILTLETEGPSPMDMATTTQFREVIEWTSDDTRTFTSSVQGPDGQWTTMMTAKYTRKP